MQEHVSEPERELSSAPFKRGKVKDIYELDSEELLFVFTDRVSAYDIVLPSTIPRKGEVLCKLAAYWLNYLKVPHHMIRVEDANRMVVRKLKMIHNLLNLILIVLKHLIKNKMLMKLLKYWMKKLKNLKFN